MKNPYRFSDWIFPDLATEKALGEDVWIGEQDNGDKRKILAKLLRFRKHFDMMGFCFFTRNNFSRYYTNSTDYSTKISVNQGEPNFGSELRRTFCS